MKKIITLLVVSFLILSCFSAKTTDKKNNNNHHQHGGYADEEDDENDWNKACPESIFPKVPTVWSSPTIGAFFGPLYQIAKNIDCTKFAPELNQTTIDANALTLQTANSPIIDRVTVVLADGTYYSDTNSAPPKENHNTRICVMTAELSKCGIGWEKKHSNTVGNDEYYVCRRCDVTGHGWHLGSSVVRIATFSPV